MACLMSARSHKQTFEPANYMPALASAPRVKIVPGYSTYLLLYGSRMDKASYQWQETYLVRSVGRNGIALVAVQRARGTETSDWNSKNLPLAARGISST